MISKNRKILLNIDAFSTLTSDKAQSVHARRTTDVGTHRPQAPAQLQDGADPVGEDRMKLLSVEHSSALEDDQLLFARRKSA